MLDPGICDAIFINAGVTHVHLPRLARLSERGRIVLPLTTGSGRGVTVKIIRDHDGLGAQVVGEVAIYSCTSVRDPR